VVDPNEATDGEMTHDEIVHGGAQHDLRHGIIYAIDGGVRDRKPRIARDRYLPFVTKDPGWRRT